ncbi:hypothetical protein OAL00_00590 [Verrucomicrobiales bacterium]|nr:hypothetical protein [Verrucomicrobiales bacterium]
MSISDPYHGPIPVSDYAPEEEENWEDYRWMGQIPEMKDFPDIRDYADCCLQGNDPNGRWRPDVLSPDLTILDGVLWQLDQEIPWFSEEDEESAIDHVPERPKDLPRPRYRSKKKTSQTVERALGEWQKKQAHINELQKYWDQNKSKLKERVKLGKFIAMVKKAHQIKKNAIARLRKQISVIQKGGSDLPAVQDLNWVMLPGGESIWSRISRSTQAIQRRYPAKQLDASRLEKIAALCPDEVYQGKHEFDGYFVFLFHRVSRAVLECPWVGNAIYVIHGDWRKLSRLTKSDLLSRHQHEVRRIIHRESGNWYSDLKRSLS